MRQQATSNVQVAQKKKPPKAAFNSNLSYFAKAQTKVFFHPRDCGCQSSDCQSSISQFTVASFPFRGAR
jgi:hypothetical protein